MNTTGLYDLFRGDVVDLAKPYLWSDDEVFAYMTDAQNCFCRLGYGIADVTTPEVVQVPIVTGEEYAPVHKSIVNFRLARLKSTNHDLELRDLLSANSSMIGDYGNVFNATTEHRPGPVRGMVIGEQKDVVRWVGIPQEDDTALLAVYRLPLNQALTFDQEFEIEEQHHFTLLAWMKFRAYSKQDAETFDRAKAQENKLMFEQDCARAKREWERYKHKPRSIGYGGIGTIGVDTRYTSSTRRW